MSNIKENWRGFLSAIFDPWVLVLFGLTSGMLALSYLYAQSIASSSNSLIFPIFSSWIAISAGILGSKIAKGLSNRNQSQDLITRGCSTIRDLKLLFTNLVTLENRISFRLGQSTNLTSDSLRLYCEEIIEKFTMLKEEIINSIEDWADVIPDAKLKSHIEVFNDLKLALYFSRVEIENLKKQIKATNELIGGVAWDWGLNLSVNIHATVFDDFFRLFHHFHDCLSLSFFLSQNLFCNCCRKRVANVGAFHLHGQLCN